MKILVLGATGMLGSAVYALLARSSGYSSQGTVRSSDSVALFAPDLQSGLVPVNNLEDIAEVERLLDRCAPDAVINCLSIQKPFPSDPMKMISMFALLPKRLSLLCRNRGIRFLQIGTDGVFSGIDGNYHEADIPDPCDVYGVAKLLGETECPQAITLRTSIIGPELRGNSGLLEWFLGQKGRCLAYTRVVFSGLPSNVLAEILRDHVLPRPELVGVYHVAAPAISKFNLLQLINLRYGKNVELVAETKTVSDRSLDTSRFEAATGYQVPDWKHLIEVMHSFHNSIKRK